MQYLYETHCHCSQASRCAHSSSRELVQAYHKAGYAGMVLTDHFIHGNTAIPRHLPWEQRMARYYYACLEAKALGDKLDFDVIFGIEHAYGAGKEVLIYGVELDFLLKNPDIPSLNLDSLVERVHDAGGIVIQAHPYRNRSYVDMSVEPRWDIVDGFEAYNSGNQSGEDRKALALAPRDGYILTCGGDIHNAQETRIGQAGILLPHRVHTSKEFADALKQRVHSYLVCGRELTHILEADLP